MRKLPRTHDPPGPTARLCSNGHATFAVTPACSPSRCRSEKHRGDQGEGVRRLRPIREIIESPYKAHRGGAQTRYQHGQPPFAGSPTDRDRLERSPGRYLGPPAFDLAHQRQLVGPRHRVHLVVAGAAVDEHELWAEYLDGAVHSYRKARRRKRTRRRAAPTVVTTPSCSLLHSTPAVESRPVYGRRDRCTMADDSHAVVEWEGQPGLTAVRKMIDDRAPFGVLEMKSAWVTDDRERNRPLDEGPRAVGVARDVADGHPVLHGDRGRPRARSVAVVGRRGGRTHPADAVSGRALPRLEDDVVGSPHIHQSRRARTGFEDARTEMDTQRMVSTTASLPDPHRRLGRGRESWRMPSAARAGVTELLPSTDTHGDGSVPVSALPLAPKNPLPFRQRIAAVKEYHTGTETLRDAGGPVTRIMLGPRWLMPPIVLATSPRRSATSSASRTARSTRRPRC